MEVGSWDGLGWTQKREVESVGYHSFAVERLDFKVKVIRFQLMNTSGRVN